MCTLLHYLLHYMRREWHARLVGRAPFIIIIRHVRRLNVIEMSRIIHEDMQLRIIVFFELYRIYLIFYLLNVILKKSF